MCTVGGELTLISAQKTCICPGWVTYQCTVMSGFGGATTFRGSFVGCTGSGHKPNEITLFHAKFNQPEGVNGSCNNDTIIGHSFSAENNMSYSSMLNITVTSELMGSTVECINNNGTCTHEVGTVIITSTGV